MFCDLRTEETSEKHHHQKNKNIIKKNKKTIPVLLWDIFMAVPVKQRHTSSFFIAFYTVRFGLYFLGKKM